MEYTKHIIIGVILLIIGAIAFGVMTHKKEVARNNKLDDLFAYLSQASFMAVEECEFNIESRQQSVSTIFETDSSTIIAEFIDVLSNTVDIDDSEIEIEKIHCIPSDYRVVLECKRAAVLDFVFEGSINEVCLRNEDYFFRADFIRENISVMQQYFESLN